MTLRQDIEDLAGNLEVQSKANGDTVSAANVAAILRAITQAYPEKVTFGYSRIIRGKLLVAACQSKDAAQLMRRKLRELGEESLLMERRASTKPGPWEVSK